MVMMVMMVLSLEVDEAQMDSVLRCGVCGTNWSCNVGSYAAR
jgi:transcription elongation factor Elf1